VLAADAAAKAGWPTARIVEYLKVLQQKTEVIYTLDTLEYLARGGRIGRVEALAGQLLKIKPIIDVNKSDGKYSTVAKARTLQRAETIIADHLFGLYNSEPVWVTVLHGKFAEHAGFLADQLKKRLNCARLEIMRISPVLGVHTGPNIVGAAVIPMALMAESGLR
jgi:DegV family protein with EDD domain